MNSNQKFIYYQNKNIMTKIKYSLLIALCSLFLLNSCKDDNTNVPDPIVTINDEKTKIDTIKHSTQEEYEAFIEIDGGTPPYTIDMDDNIPNVTVHGGLKQVEGTILTINDDDTTLTLQNFTRPANNNDIEIIMTINISDDNFQHGEAELVLTVLGNQSPIPELEIEALDNDGITLSKKINGCNSIDGDADYGGNIVTYKFTIAEEGKVPFYVYEDSNCEINYVFPKSGTYTITLEVMDNEEMWSEKINTAFAI